LKKGVDHLAEKSFRGKNWENTAPVTEETEPTGIDLDRAIEIFSGEYAEQGWAERSLTCQPHYKNPSRHGPKRGCAFSFLKGVIILLIKPGQILTIYELNLDAYDSIFEIDGLTAYDILAYLYLCDFSGEEDRYAHAYETIARKCRISETEAKQVLKRLEEKNLLNMLSFKIVEPEKRPKLHLAGKGKPVG